MNNLEQRRLEAGYTQLGLAKASGVSRDTIRRIEEGRAKRINKLTIYRLKKVLGDLSEEH
jgi:DNA-binding XRE family transcriptional regulator